MSEIRTVAVFGADGRTGKHVVCALLSSGFDVIASVYSEKGKSMFSESVQVKVGSIMDGEYVRDVIKQADAFVSVVGHVKGSDARMQTVGIQKIISAMKAEDKARVLSLTGTGVRIQGDTPSLIDRILNFIVKIIDPERVNDGINHAEELRRSGLDWTILRVLKLSDTKHAEGSYRLTQHGPAELSTPRAKVGNILTDLLENTDYFGKMPVSS